MKRLVLAGLLTVASCFAGSNVAVFPYGIWPTCEKNPTAYAACASIVPGSEKYLVMLNPTSEATIAFSYSIDVVMRDTGELKHFEGSALRSLKYQWTALALSFGGPVDHYKVVSTELVATAVAVEEK